MNAPASTLNDMPTKRRRGCLFYGCLTSCVLLIFMLLGLLLGLRHLKKMITDFTDAQPIALPAAEYSPAQVKEVNQRIESFQAAVEAHRTTEPLALSAEDLNLLVATRPEVKGLRGKLHVAIEDNQLQTQVSLPLAEMGLPMFKGRYLNGTATLGVSLQDGQLTVTAQGIASKGKALPAIYEEKIRQQNLAAKLNTDARFSTAVGNLQSLEIKEGKVILLAKPAGSATPPAAPAP